MSRRRLLLLIFCASQALAISIDGRVVNAATNEPIPAADIVLTCLIDNPGRQPNPCKDTTSKALADGTFHLNVRYAGRYRIKASAEGLVVTSSSQVEVGLGYQLNFSVNDIVLKLAPESTLTGKVFDEKGQPQSGVNVEALRVSTSGTHSEVRQQAGTVTTPDGTYVLHGLISGNYYIATPLKHDEKTDTAHPFLLYAPDALSLDQASLTHVDTGQTTAGPEIHLRPVVYYKIQGRAQMDAATKPQLHLDARDSTGLLLPARDIPLDSEGKFETEVLPGAYTLRLTGAGSGPQTAAHLLAKQDVEVSGKDLLGLIVLIPPPMAITGHVIWDGFTPTNVGGSITVRSLDSSSSAGVLGGSIQPDGSFALANCEPAKYGLHIFPPSGTYVKSIVFNQQDITNGIMDLAKGSGGDLTVTIRRGLASLSGAVSDGSGDSQTLFDITFIPENYTPNPLSPLRHVSSKDGHFNASSLPPGHYTVIATTGLEDRLWETPAFLQAIAASGVGVDLAENDQKTVTVPYVTFAEVDQLRTRLGID